MLYEVITIDSAVDVLKSAVSNAAGTPELSALAQSNLAIALLDRGYRRLEANKGAEALADLELAQQYEKQLKGNQPALLRFLLAMAYLEAGNWTKAAAAVITSYSIHYTKLYEGERKMGF